MKMLVDGAIGLGITVIVVALVAMILTSFQTQITANYGANTVAGNATTAGLSGMNQIASMFGLIGLVVVGVFILALVIGSLGGIQRQA